MSSPPRAHWERYNLTKGGHFSLIIPARKFEDLNTQERMRVVLAYQAAVRLHDDMHPLVRHKRTYIAYGTFHNVKHVDARY